MLDQTRLEAYLSEHKLKQSLCTCVQHAPELHIAKMVYIKCRYCNLPFSKVLTLTEATKIQNQEI